MQEILKVTSIISVCRTHLPLAYPKSTDANYWVGCVLAGGSLSVFGLGRLMRDTKQPYGLQLN